MLQFISNLSPEVIICVLSGFFSVAGAVISILKSRVVAKTEHELKQLTWQREDIVSSEEEFAQMARAVSVFSTDRHNDRGAALQSVAAIRAKETGALGEALDELYSCVRYEDNPGTNRALSKVIDEKRKLRERSK